MTTTVTSSAALRQNKLLTVLLAYAAFIGIGMASTSALLGIAWTTMSVEFGQPLSALAYILFASTVGYLSSSFLSGTVMGQIGIGWTVLVGSVLLSIGLAATTFVGAFWLLIPLFLVVGVGSGFIDTGFNSYIAEHHSERTLSWLHACFGIGATVGPLIVTAILNAEQSWRVAYWLITGFCIALTVGFALIRGRWRMMAAQTARSEGGKGVHIADTLRLPAVWLGIALFFFYAGMETSPGTWMFPLYNTARGIDEATAGFWVSLYWASFTIGRIFFGAIISYIAANTLIRICLVGTVLGAVLIWWNATPEVGFAGLALFGFAQAPMFPVFISQTLGRVGAKHAPNAIGFQVAGAGIGIAGIPALIGVLAERSSLEIIPPFLVGAALICVVLYELSMRVKVKDGNV